MSLFSFPQRNNLGNIIISIFTVIVSPPLNCRNFTRPVPMRCIDRCSPLQRGCFIRVLRSHLPSSPHTIEEIYNKQKLDQKTGNGTDGYELIDTAKILEGIKSIKAVVTPRNTKHTQIVHRPEYRVSRNHGPPKMHLTQSFIHMATKHLRIPVIHTR